LEHCSVEEMETYLPLLPQHLQPYFQAAIINHDLTQKALTYFRKDKLDVGSIGALMSKHHKVLKDLLHVSHPSIDKILEIALERGAFGGKIVGSGGGGCAVILTDEYSQDIIIEALRASGVKKAYPIEISKGSHRSYYD
jgi:galactokinase